MYRLLSLIVFITTPFILALRTTYCALSCVMSLLLINGYKSCLVLWGVIGGYLKMGGLILCYGVLFWLINPPIGKQCG